VYNTLQKVEPVEDPEHNFRKRHIKEMIKVNFWNNAIRLQLI